MHKSFINISLILMLMMLPSKLTAQYLESVSKCIFHDKYNTVAKVGNYLYCGGFNGLQILSIEYSQNPVFIKNCNLGIINQIKVIDNYVFTVGSGLKIFNISDTLNPEQIGYLQYGYNLIEIVDDIAYTASNRYYFGAQLFVIDISEYTEPALIDSIMPSNSTYEIRGIALNENYLFVSWTDIDLPGGGSLDIYNIENPSNPVLINSLNLWMTDDVALSGNYAYITRDDGYGLYIMDINTMVIIDSLANVHGSQIEIIGDYAYTLGHYLYNNEAFTIININNPLNPYIESIYNDGHGGNYLYIENDTLYYIRDRIDDFYYYDYQWLSDILLFDASQPANPDYLGEYNVPGAVKYVKNKDGYAYVACDRDGLRVVDISNFAEPEVIYHVEINGRMSSFFISGNYTYLTNYSEGLLIYDISNPENAYQVGTYDTLDYSLQVFVEDNTAYLINTDYYDYRLILVDVSEPATPTTIATFEDSNLYKDIVVKGDTVYTITLNTLEIIDFSDPSSPNHLGSYIFEQNINHFCLNNNYAYFTSYNGLEILDISNTNNPFLVGSLDSLPGNYISVLDDYAYLSSGIPTDLYIIDITNPEHPELITTYEYEGRYEDINSNVDIIDQNILVPNYIYFDILSFHPNIIEPMAIIPCQFTLLYNYPNPFNASTTIRYSLPKPTDITIDIYDMLGRKVKTLYSGQQQTGVYSVVWNADRFSSGIYFYKLTAGDYSQTQRMMLLK